LPPDGRLAAESPSATVADAKNIRGPTPHVTLNITDVTPSAGDY
jgi:hypothetical protein